MLSEWQNHKVQLRNYITVGNIICSSEALLVLHSL